MAEGFDSPCAPRQFGLNFDIKNPYTASLLDRTAAQITSVSETTRAQVRKVMADAYDEGLSVPETAKRIQAKMKEANRARATLIARTEFTGMANGGSLAAAQMYQDAASEAGEPGFHKKWLTGQGAPHPRHETYAGLNGQTRKLKEPFNVGGFALQHPGDPAGPAKEVCNCRCAVAYVEAGAVVEPAETSPPAVTDTPSPEALAAEIVARAQAVEQDISKVMESTPGRLEGFQYRLKEEKSLARKIRSDAAHDGISETDAAGLISDAVRYTKVFEPGEYAAGTRSAVDALRARGYQVVKWKDTWDTEMYKGVNAVFRAPNGTRFEVQFHTPDSFVLKNEVNHSLYELWRSTNDARERWVLSSRMRRHAAKLARPPDTFGFNPLTG